MHVVVTDQSMIVYHFDDADPDKTVCPSNVAVRNRLVHSLTEALTYLLLHKPGNLDREV